MTQYELWSVLGQWAGAIATTVAVIVALRTSKLPYLKKVKVQYNSGFSVGFPVDEEYLIVTAINIGNRDVKISMIGLLLDDKQFFVPATIGECQKVIKPAESVQHRISIADLKMVLAKNSIDINTKVYAFVRDEEGTLYKKYLKAMIKDIIK